MRERGVVFLLALAVVAGCGGSRSAGTAQGKTRRVRTKRTTKDAPKETPAQRTAAKEPTKEVKRDVASAKKRLIEDQRRLKVMDLTVELRTGKTPRDRVAAAKELACLHDTFATTHLMTRIAEDPDASVKYECVRTLGSLEDTTAVPLLVTLLEDEDLRLAETALGALGAITNREYAFSEGTTIKARKKTAEKWRAWFKALKD